MTAACLAVFAVLIVGWLGWQNLYAAGWAGTGIFLFIWLGIKIAEK